MDTPRICTICNQSSEITYKLQDAIHHPDSFSFDGAKDLEITFRKILKLNSSEQNQRSYVCQQCNYEFCRTYGVLHRFAQTENILQQLKSITVPKKKVTAMRTVNPMLDPNNNNRESAQNASNLQSNDELKLTVINQEFDDCYKIAEIPLTIKKEELFIDDTATESTALTAQPTTIVATTHRGNILICPECGEIFSSVQALAFHRRNHYSGKFACDQCNSIFENYNQFRLHKNSHVDASFDCSKCNAKFLYRSSLTSHMKEVHMSRMFNCNELHMHVHIGETGEIFACHECPSKFANKSALKLHAERHKFKCSNCRQDFHSQVQLENHRQEKLRFHQHIHKRFYKCNDCDMIIHEKQSLYKHRLIHSEKVIQSGSNHEKFASQPALKYHKQNNFKKCHMCEQCGKRFTKLPTLKSHQLLHTEPKFACDECDAKYYFQQSLEEHRIVHTMIVQFPCNKYDKNLPDTKSLKRHERESHLNKHYDENPFPLELSYDCDQP